MRLTRFALLCVCLFVVVGSSKSQGHLTKLTLHFNRARLDTVFAEIMRQTNFNFRYDPEWLPRAKPVTVHIQNATILEALDTVFEKQPFTYAFSGSTITIISKNYFASMIKEANEVKGMVVDENEAPMAGVTVRIRGTNAVTVTDKSGEFVLDDPKKINILELSHVGYHPEIIKLKARTDVVLHLEQNPLSLEVVEAQAYTTARRRYNLGTSKSIGRNEILMQPTTGPFAVLEGRVAGMQVVQQSGLPGGNYHIQIRGQRSVGVIPGALPSNSPLVLLDGVPLLSSAENLTQFSQIAANSPFNSINPEDIESIEIFKDANAMSIYGSMGANGVIVISSRAPKLTKTALDITLRTGIGKVTRRMDYMNTEQYLEMRKEAFSNDATTATVTNAPDLLLWDSTRYTDWSKELLGGTSLFSSAHLRLWGGTGVTQFTMAVGYSRETTVFPGTAHRKLATINSRVYHVSPDGKFDLTLLGDYGYDQNNLYTTDLTSAIEFSAPNLPNPFDSLGQLVFRSGGQLFFNPYNRVLKPYTAATNRLTGNLRLKYDIMDGLRIKANLGYNDLLVDEMAAILIASEDTSVYPKGQGSRGVTKMTNWIIEPQIEFTTAIGRQTTLKLLVGSSLRKQTGKQTGHMASNFFDDRFLLAGNFSMAGISKVNDNYKEYRLTSVYGLLNSIICKKYVVEITARRDGSTRFGPKNIYGLFGSAAAGWIFSEEKFLQGKLGPLSYGKLRMSYGTAGNDQIGDHEYLDNWTMTRYPYLPQSSSFKPVSLYNNEFSWELHKTLDIGLHLGFAHDRVLFSAIWNKSTTSKQLISVPLAIQTGFTQIIKNVPAKVTNHNIEIDVTSITLRKRNVHWTTSFNFTITRNKLLQFPTLPTSTYGNYYLVGQPLGILSGYRTSGVNATSGLYQILDRNGDPIDLSTGFPTDEDMVKFGAYNPSWFAGLCNNIHLKNWQINFMFQFVKQKGLNQVALLAENAGFYQFNQPAAVANRWRKPGDNAPFQQYTQDPSSLTYLAAMLRSSSEDLLVDASFIRMRSLSVSYTVPYRWIKKLKIVNCTFAIETQNLLTLTKYAGNNDPENGTINPRSLPPLKSIAFCIRSTL